MRERFAGSAGKVSVPIVRPLKGKHVVHLGDSARSTFESGFDLVITSPPFFHPLAGTGAHGKSAVMTDLDEFAIWVARILHRIEAALKPNGSLVVLKTDVKYRRTVIPVGFKIVEACDRMGLRLRAHWIWQRFPQFSPYSPSFSNIFILGGADPKRLQVPPIISGPRITRGFPTSFVPGIFQILIERLTDPGDIVLDPFFGIGSVSIAAANTHRWSTGVEISEEQFQRSRTVLSHISNVKFLSSRPLRIARSE